MLQDVAAQVQRVWQLEQPPEQQRAAGLRLAAAAAHRGCANLCCTNLGGTSESDSRGKKCRWAGLGGKSSVMPLEPQAPWQFLLDCTAGCPVHTPALLYTRA